MPTVTINQFRTRQFGGASGAYGNVTELAFQLKTAASGGAIGADSAAALAIADKVVLGVLPSGMRLDDMTMIVSTAMTAAVTGTLGFEYDDGVDSVAVPQDAAYFGAGLVLNAAGRLRMATAKAPVILPKPAKLILVTAGAANAKVSQIDVLITGELGLAK
jgi:hypothetical protein